MAARSQLSGRSRRRTSRPRARQVTTEELLHAIRSPSPFRSVHAAISIPEDDAIQASVELEDVNNDYTPTPGYGYNRLASPTKRRQDGEGGSVYHNNHEGDVQVGHISLDEEENAMPPPNSVRLRPPTRNFTPEVVTYKSSRKRHLSAATSTRPSKKPHTTESSTPMDLLTSNLHNHFGAFAPLILEPLNNTLDKMKIHNDANSERNFSALRDTIIQAQQAQKEHQDNRFDSMQSAININKDNIKRNVQHLGDVLMKNTDDWQDSVEEVAAARHTITQKRIDTVQVAIEDSAKAIETANKNLGIVHQNTTGIQTDIQTRLEQFQQHVTNTVVAEITRNENLAIARSIRLDNDLTSVNSLVGTNHTTTMQTLRNHTNRFAALSTSFDDIESNLTSHRGDLRDMRNQALVDRTAFMGKFTELIGRTNSAQDTITAHVSHQIAASQSALTALLGRVQQTLNETSPQIPQSLTKLEQGFDQIIKLLGRDGEPSRRAHDLSTENLVQTALTADEVHRIRNQLKSQNTPNPVDFEPHNTPRAHKESRAHIMDFGKIAHQPEQDLEPVQSEASGSEIRQIGSEKPNSVSSLSDDGIEDVKLNSNTATSSSRPADLDLDSIMGLPDYSSQMQANHENDIRRVMQSADTQSSIFGLALTHETATHARTATDLRNAESKLAGVVIDMSQAEEIHNNMLQNQPGQHDSITAQMQIATNHIQALESENRQLHQCHREKCEEVCAAKVDAQLATEGEHIAMNQAHQDNTSTAVQWSIVDAHMQDINTQRVQLQDRYTRQSDEHVQIAGEVHDITRIHSNQATATQDTIVDAHAQVVTAQNKMLNQRLHQCANELEETRKSFATAEEVNELQADLHRRGNSAVTIQDEINQRHTKWEHHVMALKRKAEADNGEEELARMVLTPEPVLEDESGRLNCSTHTQNAIYSTALEAAQNQIDTRHASSIATQIGLSPVNGDETQNGDGLRTTENNQAQVRILSEHIHHLDAQLAVARDQSKQSSLSLDDVTMTDALEATHIREQSSTTVQDKIIISHAKVVDSPFGTTADEKLRHAELEHAQSQGEVESLKRQNFALARQRAAEQERLGNVVEGNRGLRSKMFRMWVMVSGLLRGEEGQVEDVVAEARRNLGAGAGLGGELP
ncbi:hypothetical protein P153DRAFT_401647 [Dothidotthia symphoricarpi CBS 119687]|uniref:Uncharacterized protein n=1 Tax=Dothidotthia symphoricarpi CBS 119687 TaxID=1392245 RepID=A0A6A5ZVX3_9PLEO|nr:uncharacterized protein P153DRAFT_401647 [Dothidotthia symphoricarpi CBS 119687]KAF2123740.1 hypothetical protein P153DRAFT_401647 [Dothidotthia symphoricarpi CBS 119687]